MRAANEFATSIIDALDKAGIEWHAYSGRGMYGDCCVSVNCGGRRDVDEGQVLHAVRNVTAALNLTRDSMGMGTVVYWPRAKLVD